MAQGVKGTTPTGVCRVTGCIKMAELGGQCKPHYFKDWNVKNAAQTGPCSIDGCTNPGTRMNGWCRKHYERWQRTGTTDTRVSPTVDERFWSKVDKNGPSGCWLWTGAHSVLGYGGFGVSKERHEAAHRFSYQLLVGPIPKGLHLDHLCVTPACVNPEHLEPVTPAENKRRSLARRLAMLAPGQHCTTCTCHLTDEPSAEWRRRNYTRRIAVAKKNGA